MFGASDAIVNTGSTARDWCMLERNILSHIKLDLLLSLLSLLRARLSGSDDDDDELMIDDEHADVPVDASAPAFPPLSAAAQRSTLKSEIRRNR